MKDILLVLFYQIIGAVEAAVILSGIVWLAKRKDEKNGRKPNPDFTPPPTGTSVITPKRVKSPADGILVIAELKDGDLPDTMLIGDDLYKRGLARIENGVQIADYELIPKATPTTGTNVIEPKRRWDSWDEDDAEFAKVIRYAVEHECSCQAAKLALASVYNPAQKAKPPTTGSAAIKPKYGISTDEAKKLVSKLAEASACLGGNSELDELRERVKEFADRLDRVEKKPVTPERLKEAGFEVEHVNVFNPAEESAKRYETDFINAKCGDCKHYANSLDGGYCALRRCPVKAHEKRQCCIFERYKAPVRTTHICKNCKHYLTTEEGAATGLCGMKDEIAFGNSFHACFEKREKE